MAAVLGEGDDRRLGSLVAEMGCQAADDDTGRGNDDNRVPSEEEHCEVASDIVEVHIRLIHPFGVTVQLSTGKYLYCTFRGFQP